MAPNLWHYPLVFIRECYYASLVLILNLFHSYFQVCKRANRYYLIAREGFTMRGTRTSNKGWKGRYFFIDTGLD